MLKVQAGLNEKVISNIGKLLDPEYQTTNSDYTVPFGVGLAELGCFSPLFYC